MARVIALAAAAGMAGLLGATAYVALQPRSADVFAACRDGRFAGGEIGGPFTLVNGDGAAVTDAQVLAKPALVYFGFTFCSDVCPVDNARNAQAVDILEERGLIVTPVFISIDPARDTPEAMKAYGQAMHPRMIALTGTDAQVKAAAQAYKAYYAARPAADGNYLMDHSTFTYLMLPQTGFAEVFRRDATADRIAEATACFLEAA